MKLIKGCFVWYCILLLHPLTLNAFLLCSLPPGCCQEGPGSQEAADSGGTGCIRHRLHVPERPSEGREQVDQGDTEGGWSQEDSCLSTWSCACIVVCPAGSHCCRCTAVRSERWVMLVRVAVPTTLSLMELVLMQVASLTALTKAACS